MLWVSEQQKRMQYFPQLRRNEHLSELGFHSTHWEILPKGMAFLLVGLSSPPLRLGRVHLLLAARCSTSKEEVRNHTAEATLQEMQSETPTSQMINCGFIHNYSAHHGEVHFAHKSLAFKLLITLYLTAFWCSKICYHYYLLSWKTSDSF